MKITPGHCRLLKYCNAGIKEVCSRHDIDYRQLFKGGIPIEELEPIEDAFIQRLVKLVREEI